MPRLRPDLAVALTLVALVSVTTLLFTALDLPALAAPWSQFPTASVTVISDPPPPDLPGQFSERTLLRPNLLDPDPDWNAPTFNDGSWLDSYPVVRQPGWGDPLNNPASPADFIWGGPPGTGPDANGRFTIPLNPAPQFLFLRKNFCIPLNANLASIAAGPLDLEVAATPGSASVYYNGAPIATGLAGNETNFVYTLNLDPLVVNNVRRVGRNTLALRVRDDVADTGAGVAYALDFNYTIDPTALTLNANPPGPTTVNTAVIFNQTNNGLSGDGPFTFQWDLGNGTTSTAPAPSITYTAPGTYTVALTMTDRFGCPSAPVTLTHVVLPGVEINFSQAVYTVAENAGPATITVVLSAPSTQPVTVNYTTANGSATAGSDYTAAGGVLTFPPGVISQTFTIPISADSLPEANETVILTLSGPANGVIGATNPATLVITDQTTAGGNYVDEDDDDDDDSSPPAPPPPAAPAPAPTPTAIIEFPTTLPETGLWSDPAGFGPTAVIFTLGGLLVAVVVYWVARRPGG